MLPKFEEIKDKNILVEQTKSVITTTKKQRASLRGLGLRTIGSTFECKCTQSIYGMLVKTAHLIKVSIK